MKFVWLICLFGAVTCVEVRSLCSFIKSNTSCACYYRKNALTPFPILHADCTRMELDNFPRDSQLPDVEDLDLSYNLITKLDAYSNNFQSVKIRSISLANNWVNFISPDFFANMPNLLKLDLSHNKLVNFPNSNLFRGLNHLEVLNLGFNELSMLPQDIFTSMKHLQNLDLQSNYFRDLMMSSTNLFNTTGLTPQITSLKLDGLQINKLHYDFFNGAAKLKYISLSNNPLVEIPTVPYSVDYLDLSGSEISSLSARHLNYHSLKVLKLNRLLKLETIEHYAFYNLQALETLELSDCRNLREFNDLAFGLLSQTGEWALKKITLARSGLTSLNSTYLRLFTQLKHVDLSSNPWYCDCGIIWLQILNGTLFKDQNMRCLKPYTLLNKKIMQLNKNDIPGCVSDNPFQRIVISILAGLVAVLVVLIIYLMYLGPFYSKNKYRGIGPESPYVGNTIDILPNRAEY